MLSVTASRQARKVRGWNAQQNVCHRRLLTNEAGKRCTTPFVKTTNTAVAIDSILTTIGLFSRFRLLELDCLLMMWKDR